MNPDAITATGWPVQVVSTGVRQLFVPVRSLKEIQALSPKKQDTNALSQVLAALDPDSHCHECLMVLTIENTEFATSNVHTRLFAPGISVPEDPATGSASGGLGAYMVKHGVVTATAPTMVIMSEQGIEMGRPSVITIEVDGTPDAISMVRVGGSVVPMIEGVLRW